MFMFVVIFPLLALFFRSLLLLIRHSFIIFRGKIDRSLSDHKESERDLMRVNRYNVEGEAER